MTTSTYETDFYAWTVEQAALLRQARFGEADIPNIIEEIEGLGRGEKRILRRLLEGLLTRLLRWQTQDGGRSGCWRAATEIWRLRLHQHLAESPSLRDPARGDRPRVAVRALQGDPQDRVRIRELPAILSVVDRAGARLGVLPGGMTDA